MTTSSFRDQHLDLQHLVRELRVLRNHNLKFKEGAPQDTMLMFAEAALVVLVLERFVRVLLGDATDRETLHNLLERAVSRRLIRLPWDDQQEGIKKIVGVRNTMLHGNYEQAAREAGCSKVPEYFKTQFAGEVERLYLITNEVFTQIDPETGKPRSP